MFNELNGIIDANVTYLATDATARNAIKETLRTSPQKDIRDLCNNQISNGGLSPSDFSLIAAAITQSDANGKTFIITDDEDLRKAVEYLYQQHTITLSNGQLSTRELFPWGIFKYSSSFHQCCLFSNDLELRIIENVAANDVSRDMNANKKTLKSNHIREAIELLIPTINTKMGVA